MINIYKDKLEHLEEAVEGKDAKTTTNHKEFEDRLAKVEVSKASMYEFHGNITRIWSTESQHILEYIL